MLVDEGVSPRVSPDGRWVAYTTRSTSTVFLVAARGGKPRKLAERLYPVTWSPTSRLLVGWRKGSIVAVDLEGNETLLDAVSQRGDWSFSPTGRRIVFVDGRPCHTNLYVEDVTGGRPHQITHDGLATRAVWTRHGILYARDVRCNAYATEVWAIDPDGSNAHRVARLARRVPGDYGLTPIDWRGSSLLAGIVTEWGDIAVGVDAATGAVRRVHRYWYASDLSHDGKRVLLFGGGAEGPYTIAWAPFAGGRVHVIAHGDVGYESWNG